MTDDVLLDFCLECLLQHLQGALAQQLVQRDSQILVFF